ncbi:MAG: tetratricopeptide repeat protein [Gemmataceae bacterium]|nr:tetratricopeptide repeat protein [Gemmataceae bacterium]
MRLFVPAAILLLAAGLAAAQDKKDEKKDKEVEKLLGEIEAAMKDRKYADVVPLAKKLAEVDPKNPAAPLAAATAHTSLRQNEEAAKAWTKLLEIEPKAVRAYDSRGDAYHKMGKFKEAIADFDEYLKHDPKFAPDHWRRGIALYYAGRFKDGVEQFELHRKVNPEDVENSAWHYLCNARANTPKKAREDLIPVTKDTRVPMNKVLELFAGKIKPKDVLDAAEGAKLKDEELKEARFYANLYVALFYESEGDAKKCQEHLTAAVEKYKIGHYMWDVADVHLKGLKQGGGGKGEGGKDGK